MENQKREYRDYRTTDFERIIDLVERNNADDWPMIVELYEALELENYQWQQLYDSLQPTVHLQNFYRDYC